MIDKKEFCNELRAAIADYDAETRGTHDKFKARMAMLFERIGAPEANELESMIEAAQSELDRLRRPEEALPDWVSQ